MLGPGAGAGAGESRARRAWRSPEGSLSSAVYQLPTAAVGQLGDSCFSISLGRKSILIAKQIVTYWLANLQPGSNLVFAATVR